MDSIALNLASELVDRLQSESREDARIIVGVAGIPASGKSTFAEQLCRHVNRLLATSTAAAVLVGLDGWHLTRAQLDAMEDPKLARDKRGAHWTFDAAGYLAFVRLLRSSSSSQAIIQAPSFDHAQKDPVFNSVSIHPNHLIVIIEGLYTFLDTDGWRDAAHMLDERWYIRLDMETARERLIKRHVQSGVASDTEEARWRADTNDLINGQFIIDNLVPPTKVIDSIEDPVLHE